MAVSDYKWFFFIMFYKLVEVHYLKESRIFKKCLFCTFDEVFKSECCYISLAYGDLGPILRPRYREHNRNVWLRTHIWICHYWWLCTGKTLHTMDQSEMIYCCWSQGKLRVIWLCTGKTLHTMDQSEMIYCCWSQG